MTAPDIKGDGVHDDTEGLNAAFSRRPFTCSSRFVSSERGHFFAEGGDFLVSDTITVSEEMIVVLNGSNISIHKPINGPLWNVHGKALLRLAGITINGEPVKMPASTPQSTTGTPDGASQ